MNLKLTFLDKDQKEISSRFVQYDWDLILDEMKLAFDNELKKTGARSFSAKIESV